MGYELAAEGIGRHRFGTMDGDLRALGVEQVCAVADADAAIAFLVADGIGLVAERPVGEECECYSAAVAGPGV